MVSRLNIVLSLDDRASRGLQGLSGRLDKLKGGLERIRLPLLAITGAVAGMGVVGVRAASDLEESINAVNVVFGRGAPIIQAFGKTAATSVGLARSEFNQLASVTGALLADTGRPIEEVAQLTTQLAVRAADMASVMNTDVKDALFAVNAALRGETEPIRRYTGDVTDATLSQFALANGITKSVTEMNEQEKRLLRLQVVMQQTEKFAGDFANTSTSFANSVRIVKSQVTDVAAELGTKLLPSLAKVIGAVSVGVDWFAKLNPNLLTTALFGVGVAGALAAIGLVLPPVVTGVQLLTKTLLTLKAVALWPVGLGILALVGPTLLLIATFDKLREVARAVFVSVAETVQKAINFMLDGINHVIEGINKISLVTLPTMQRWDADMGAIFDSVNVNMDAGVQFLKGKMEELKQTFTGGGEVVAGTTAQVDDLSDALAAMLGSLEQAQTDALKALPIAGLGASLGAAAGAGVSVAVGDTSSHRGGRTGPVTLNEIASIMTATGKTLLEVLRTAQQGAFMLAPGVQRLLRGDEGRLQSAVSLQRQVGVGPDAQISQMLGRGSANGITVVLEGDIYGMDDFNRRVAEAVVEAREQGADV